MKRLLLSWALLLCPLSAIFAQFSGSGSGTESDPYLIFYADQLSQVRNFLNKDGVYFKLMTDIDLTDWIEENSPSQGWQPIGVEASPFKGIFDGNNHTISSLNIKRSSTDNVGFFGYADGATFKNIVIDESAIEGKANVGTICGYANASTFTDNHVKSISISSNGDNLGGIAGTATKSTFSNNNVVSTNVIGNGNNNVGGMVGAGDQSFDSNSVVATIYGKDNVGGVCGFISIDSNTSFSNNHINCYINGNDKVGGHIGLSRAWYLSVDKSAFYGNIKANSYCGGIAGSIERGYNNSETPFVINNSFAICDIECLGNNIGGILGYDGGNYYRGKNYVGGTFLTIDIKESYYSGNLQGADNVGGIVGHKYLGSIIKCLSMGSVRGTSCVGGIVGDIQGHASVYSDKSHAYSKQNVSIISEVSASNEKVGRIFGGSNNYWVEFGALGTSDGNLALSTMIVSVSGVVQEITDDEQNGTSMGRTGLKLKANYVAHGWDFNNDWAIQETETYPYKPWQTAPPYVESGLTSQSTTVAGKSVDGGTVYIQIGDDYVDSVKCSGNQFSFTVPALQSGERVRLYAVSEGKWQSPYTDETVSYPGKGTEADPYLVYTASDLQGVYKRGHYKLMNDIDLTEWINANSAVEGWPAVGKNGISKIYFDGGGHTVSGLWSKTNYEYNGLFSNFPGGSIQNLTVKTAEGKSVDGGVYAGILIGRIANATISNVTVEGKVASSSANAKIGGIAGEANGGSLTGCQANVAIEASGDSTMAGGLVGSSSAAVNSSYSQGSVSLTGNSTYAGGLIGQNLAAGTVKDCYSLADVSSKLYSAGLVSYNYGAVSNSYAKGNVSSLYYGAGVAGYNDGASASTSGCVAGNPKIDISDQSGWSIRVLGGFKNGAAQPGENNYALNTMILSVNGVTKKASDNILDGYAKTEEVLERQATYETLGWDFTNAWSIDEGHAWPLLKQGGVVNGITVAPSHRTTSENTIYDLQGRRVLKPSKGLYIVNGKKVIIR